MMEEGVSQLSKEEIIFFGMNKSWRLRNILICFYTIGIIFLTGCSQKESTAFDYQIPIEEIAERLEYEYVYENMIGQIADYDYKQLSFLPSGKDIPISVYVVEGNKLLFLPEDKTNVEALVNDEVCRLHYCEEAGGFVFYVLVDWQLSENGVPVNSLEDDYYHRIRECIVRDKEAVYEKVNNVDSPLYFMYEFALEDMVKLGDVKVSFEPEKIIELQKIPVNDNEYIDAILEYVSRVLREKQKYGNFQICLETYGRVPDKHEECTQGRISAAVIGEEYEDYLYLSIADDGDGINKESVWSVYAPALVDSTTYFSSKEHLEVRPEGFIQGIMGLQREVLELEVKEEESGEEAENNQVILPEYNSEMDFCIMGTEKTAELINYVYSYEEWFGMNELGCKIGELRGLQGETILMYACENQRDRLFFVPQSKVNTSFKSENGQSYPVYVNNDGEMEFYCLKENHYVEAKGQLKTSFFIKESLSTRYATDMVWLGETELSLQGLASLNNEKVEEDKYICAFRKYIEDILKQNGKSGEYEINIGEYEALYTNKVCLSAAVVGEEESYYFRNMIVKSGEESYYFWSIGFGLNGTLEECEAQRHYMNALCIERTKQLARNKIVVKID